VDSNVVVDSDTLAVEFFPDPISMILKPLYRL
jgi:hypothetical protein